MKTLTIKMKDSIYSKIVKYLTEEFNDIPVKKGVKQVNLEDVKAFIDFAIANKLGVDELEVFMDKDK